MSESPFRWSFPDQENVEAGKITAISLNRVGAKPAAHLLSRQTLTERERAVGSACNVPPRR